MTEFDSNNDFDDMDQFEPEWRWASMTNNPWFRFRTWRVTVFPDRHIQGGWKYVVSHGEDKPHFGSRVFLSQQEAMDGAKVAFIAQRRRSLMADTVDGGVE